MLKTQHYVTVEICNSHGHDHDQIIKSSGILRYYNHQLLATFGRHGMYVDN